MIPKKNRLTRREIVEVREKGKIKGGKRVSILYIHTGGEVPRFGMIVSSRVAKLAVERNRIKRVLREAFKEILGKISSGYSIVVLARKSMMGAGVREVAEELEEIMRLNGMICAGK